MGRPGGGQPRQVRGVRRGRAREVVVVELEGVALDADEIDEAARLEQLDDLRDIAWSRSRRW